MHYDSLSEVDLQNYHQLLVDHTLISQSQASQALEEFNSPSTPDYSRCPICLHRLITCHGCSRVTCDNHVCQGANLVGIASSSCQLCFSTLMTLRSQWCDQVGCRSCIHVTHEGFCPDCVRPTDIICPCGGSWVCGGCVTQKKFPNQCCPKCQNYFCFFGCKYIGACAECKKMTLCNDCMELEEDTRISDEVSEGSSIATKGVVLVTAACNYCQRRICADCLGEREDCCGYCSRVSCRSCGMGNCFNCQSPLCRTCKEVMCQRCKNEFLRTAGTWKTATAERILSRLRINQ